MTNKLINIALIGNPNSGKTTLFNVLTGSNQKVGNWPGVTVEKKTGHFDHDSQRFAITDLPGIYHLDPGKHHAAIDGRITTDYLKNHSYDLLINIVDASHLERNLYLTLRLREMCVPMVVALNMTDIAKQKQMTIDVKALSTFLNCPVVSLVSRKKTGIPALKQTLSQPLTSSPLKITYPKAIEKTITDIQTRPNPILSRWHAINLLESGADLAQKIPEAIDLHLADARYQLIAKILKTSYHHKDKTKPCFTEILDKIFLNRFLGVPLFLVIMYLLFEVSITLGGAFQPLFDDGSRALFINGISALCSVFHFPHWLSAILADGVGLGINTVITFIPQIGAMFLCLSFLESSGYMARAAFVIDRVMQWLGLPGKSFVPLIIGFGCNVPSIMATRTLDYRKDRLLTIMMSPFMSCGARLAIFVVFAGAFFPTGGALIIFILYLLGIVIAILTGLMISKTLLKGEISPSVTELPAYHIPHINSILVGTWHRLKRFIFRAGKVIVPVCMLVGGLNSIDIHGHLYQNGSRHSLLSSFSRTITPVFSPMGITQQNWPATVGLLTGGLAKEVVIGTLNTLYTQENNPHHQQDFDLTKGLSAALNNTLVSLKQLPSRLFGNPFSANEADHDIQQSAIGQMSLAFGSTLSAFCYMLFVLLYVPCVSTIAATAKEGSKKWAILSSLWSLCVAYALAVIVYQTLSFFKHPLLSVGFISLAASMLIGFVMCLYKLSHLNQKTTTHRVIPIYQKGRS